MILELILTRFESISSELILESVQNNSRIDSESSAQSGFRIVQEYCMLYIYQLAPKCGCLSIIPLLGNKFKHPGDLTVFWFIL